MTSQFQSNNIKRRRSTVVKVGSVSVGGDHPIAVQSMTNTVTTDVEATVNQIGDIVKAGADLVRVSVPDKDSVAAFAKIRQRVSVPLIADVHFDFSIAVDLAQCGADCLRINPGNIGNDKKVAEVIAAAKDRDIPIRIGVNAGSLEKSIQRKYGEPNADALVESALRHVSILEKFNFENFKVSVKASDVLMTIAAYTKLAERIEQPLHLGITEAGSERNGAVKSAMGLGTLLMAGIGDTIRVSLAADPVQEVKVGWDILRGLHLRSRGVNIIACPSCSRQNFDVIRTVNELEARLEDITESVDLAVIGCYVNGPGESKMADIGVTGADPANLIYSSGKASHKVDNSTLVDELEKAVRDKLANQKKSVNLPAETGDTA